MIIFCCMFADPHNLVASTLSHLQIQTSNSFESQERFGSTSFRLSPAVLSTSDINYSPVNHKKIMPSLFRDIELAPPDPILNTGIAFKADQFPQKVNLGQGCYRTEQAQPWVLPVVQKVEEQLLRDLADSTVNKEYLPQDGLPALKKLTQELQFGFSDERIASAQALSGTGSLRIAGEFLAKYVGVKKIFYPDPTWGNHPTIAEASNLLTEKHPYWDPTKKGLDFSNYLNHVRSAPDGSAYLVHPCAHNPTGVDPSMEQWEELVAAFKVGSYLHARRYDVLGP